MTVLIYAAGSRLPPRSVSQLVQVVHQVSINQAALLNQRHTRSVKRGFRYGCVSGCEWCQRATWWTRGAWKLRWWGVILIQLSNGWLLNFYLVYFCFFLFTSGSFLFCQNCFSKALLFIVFEFLSFFTFWNLEISNGCFFHGTDNPQNISFFRGRQVFLCSTPMFWHCRPL